MKTRFLFSSDLHGKSSVFEAFAKELSRSKYGFGVLGGDLHDEWLPEEKVIELTGCHPDDLAEELGTGDEDPLELWKKSRARELLDKAIGIRIESFQEILGLANKPIYFVPGNHDRIPWKNNACMINVHLRRVEYLDWNLVGYRWTDLERTPDELISDLKVLNELVDDRTILISHSPAKGTLDGLAEWGTGYGIEVLNQLKRVPWLHLVGHVHSLAGISGRTVNGCWPGIRRFFGIDMKSRKTRLV